jgi:5-methylcytosine-specific restriction protein A
MLGFVPVAEAEPVPPVEPDEVDLESKSLPELRALAFAAATTPKAPSKESQRTHYVRSARVKAYVLKRRNGSCEACKNAAPFERKDGTPYLDASPHQKGSGWRS